MKMKDSLQSVGYASWLDPTKWMEDMKGSKWTQLVADYTKEYDHAVKKEDDLVTQIEKELGYRDSLSPNTLFDYSYQQLGGQSFLWSFQEGPKHVCSDLDIGSDGWIWYVKDTDSGDESYSLCASKNGKNMWTLSHSFGPFVATVKKRVYSLESENHLWYCRLVSFDAHTGTDRKIHYEEENPQWNLSLVKGENHCLFLISNNASEQRLWYLNSTNNFEEIIGYEQFIPVGFASQSQRVVYFGRKKGENTYRFSERTLPFLHHGTPEFASLGEGLVVTRSYGKRTLWDLKTGRKRDSLVGEFLPDVLSPWSKGRAQFTLSRPGYSMSLYEPTVDCLCSYAKSSYFFVKSLDGTSVPYILVQSRSQKSRTLMVVGYGAYGLPTHLNVDRWKPLLRRGWAICIALIRGGGDHTDAWAQDARTLHKIKSIEDFEAVIRSAQKSLRISPKHTAIYGRSAGGYLVGSTINRHASGDLFRCAYLEVPYLDVLSTTSNPSLPLTQLEYNEFGNPREKPQNFKALLDLSPVDTIPDKGAPSLFILCRTGLQDKEVFAYESFKFIQRLKEAQGSKGEPKLLAAEPNQGHFSGKTSADKLRARDLSLLIGWATRSFSTSESKKKYAPQIYKMLYSRRNRKNNNGMSMSMRKNNGLTMGGKRRNNMTMRKGRKNNMNMTMRKNRKNNMMGGDYHTMRKNNMMGGKRKNRKNNMTMRKNRK